MIEKTSQSMHPFRIQQVGDNEIQINQNSALFYSFDVNDFITSEAFTSSDWQEKINLEELSMQDATELYGADAPKEFFVSDQDLEGKDIIDQKVSPLKAFKIHGLGIPFSVKKGDKIYLQLDLDRTMDVKRAYIVCGAVGPRGEDSPPDKKMPSAPDALPDNFYKNVHVKDEGWPDFPSLVQLRPKKSLNPKQMKAFLLIGYVTTEYNDPENYFPIRYYDSETEETKRAYVIQVLRSNVLMTHYCQKGTPIVYPMPFYGQMNRINRKPEPSAATP